MQARRAALAFLALASPALLLAFWWGHGVGEVVFALLAAAFPVALVVLGAATRHGLGRLAIPLLVLTVILEGSLLAIWLLRGRIDELPWVGGLPLAAAIQLYGIWFVPLLLVALAYALTFDSTTLSDEALERLRRFRGTSEPPSTDALPDDRPEA